MIVSGKHSSRFIIVMKNRLGNPFEFAQGWVDYMEGEFLIQTSRGSITNEPGTTSRWRKRGCVHGKALFAGHSGVFCQ